MKHSGIEKFLTYYMDRIITLQCPYKSSSRNTTPEVFFDALGQQELCSIAAALGHPTRFALLDPSRRHTLTVVCSLASDNSAPAKYK